MQVMAALENPRNYVEAKPVTGISRKGLRVSARSALVYTCTVPDRREVAKQNYARRAHQMQKCGYNSVSYKPYKALGNVLLDDKDLVLVALGQKENDSSQYSQVSTEDKSPECSKSKLRISDDGDWKISSESQAHFMSFKSTENREDVQSQLTKGRKMISAVRLGFNLFRLIKEEQQRKAEEAELERQRKLDEVKSSMQIISPSETSDESGDEECISVKFSDNEEPNDLKPSGLDASLEEYSRCESNSMKTFLQRYHTASLKSRSTEKPYAKKKARSSSIRPYSPIFSNINCPKLVARESLFRQLCALNWILDAMSQDLFPPAMLPITNCWNIRYLQEEARTSRRKVEWQRHTESNWQTLLVNPSRFSQRSNRKGASSIFVHPQRIQRLSAVSSSSTGARQSNYPLDLEENKTSHVSVSNTNTETAPTENTTAEGENVLTECEKAHRNDETSKPEGVQEENSNTETKGSNFVKIRSFKILHQQVQIPTKRNSLLSEQQLSKLTSNVHENSSKKKESRVRAWVKQSDQRNSKARFSTAALGTFGAIRLSKNVDEIPLVMRRRFSEVIEEKNVRLHDKLEDQNKRRWRLLQRKFIKLDSSSRCTRAALEKIRHESYSDELVETGEELRQRVSEECKWYKDLINNFPDDIKHDRYIGIVLNKIAQYGSLEGRKVSIQHFLKIMATLRPWELCYPDIAAAIEFVRENIVGFSTVEYDDWFTSRNPMKHSSV